MKKAVLAVLILVTLAANLVAQENPKNDEIVILPRFEVKARGAVYLQMSFRSHLVFLGLKTLTFRIVPDSWKKAGIEIGDQVIGIDGQPIRGMGVVAFLKSGMKRTKPLADKPPSEVRTVFEIQSKATNRTWSFEFTQKASDCIIYGTPNSP
jgi:hypothetical protein